MKHLLVPVDLTAAAEHTVVYANKLAVRLGADITLLYCHHGEALGPTETAAFLERLHVLAERLRYVQLVRQDGRRLRYRYAVRSGCLHDHVQPLIDASQADLLVMNLEHIDCGEAEAAISGNHAARIAELASCPVLVVPPGTQPMPVRMAFLADFGAMQPTALPQLGQLARGLHAQLQLVHFYERLDLGSLIGIKRGMQLIKERLPGVAISSKLVLDDDPLEGISEFCAQMQTHLLAFAPADVAQLRRFFDRGYAKTRAYHTRIPVLVLPRPAAEASGFCCQHCADLQTAPAPWPTPASAPLPA